MENLFKGTRTKTFFGVVRIGVRIGLEPTTRFLFCLPCLPIIITTKDEFRRVRRRKCRTYQEVGAALLFLNPRLQKLGNVALPVISAAQCRFPDGSGRAAANTPELMLNDNPSLSVSCTDVTRKAWDGKFLHWGHKPKTKPEILILLHSIQRVIGWNSILYFFFLPVFNSYILCSESCSRICFLDRICHILISILACCLYIRNSTVTCFFCLFLGIKLLWKSFKQLQLEAFPR